MNLKELVMQVLAEEISDLTRKEIETVQPNDILTVYHGTPLFRLPELINGFDATSEHSRDYRSGGHPGLFITADFDLAKRFGGGAVLELKVKAKNIHGTDWGGKIGRHQRKDGTNLDYIDSQYPQSFRPFMTHTMLATGEPQGLLVGVVSPKQISRVWIRKGETWNELSRDEVVNMDLVYNVEYGKDKVLGDAGIDLGSPSIKLEDYIQALSKAIGRSTDRIEATFKRLASKDDESLEYTLDKLDIGGSKLGTLARKSLAKQIKSSYSEEDPAEAYIGFIANRG